VILLGSFPVPLVPNYCYMSISSASYLTTAEKFYALSFLQVFCCA